MPSLGNNVFDQGLNYLQANGTRLDICSQEPTSYAEVGTYTLGNKTGLSIGAPADRTGGGREVTVPAISDGSVTGTGSASHYAITDGAGELLAAAPLAAPQSVTSGNTFTLASFKIGIPDPA
jgi:hypothetical protein